MDDPLDYVEGPDGLARHSTEHPVEPGKRKISESYKRMEKIMKGEPAELNTEKLTGPIHASMTLNTDAVITFRNSSGDEGRLVFADDGETRFEGDPEAFVQPFMDMFGEDLNEYIDKRVAEVLNRIL